MVREAAQKLVSMMEGWQQAGGGGGGGSSAERVVGKLKLAKDVLGQAAGASSEQLLAALSPDRADRSPSPLPRSLSSSSSSDRGMMAAMISSDTMEQWEDIRAQKIREGWIDPCREDQVRLRPGHHTHLCPGNFHPPAYHPCSV
jgi:hypothetical protein